jgi:hypothetical protein
MSTRNIVPRANEEGNIGTSSKNWLSAFFKTINVLGEAIMKHISTPSNPSSGNCKLYFKSDDKLYKLTSGGAESEVGTVKTVDAQVGDVKLKRAIILKVMADDEALTIGDGKINLTIPSVLNGMNLVEVAAHVYTVSSSGLPSIAIYNVTDSQDMLSVNCTIDASENDSKDATTAPTINNSYDDVATGDVIRIDVDAAGTGTKGLEVRLTFQLS